MKSLTAVCQTGASMPAINPNGRINRPPHHRGDGENAEMKMYLSKLKDLVPFMPKNRKLSKLEIIQHVIDYICDLQSELETHPEMSNFDAAAALNFTANLERVTAAHNGHDEEGDEEEDDEMYEGIQERLNGSMQLQQQQQSSPAQRQPLVDRQTPNTILPATQQQQQIIVSAVNNTTATSNSITTTNSLAAVTSSSSTAAATTAATTTTTAAATNLSSHTLINEKDLDSSRQSC